MGRRRKGGKGGRRYNPDARRRHTTRAGRRGEAVPADLGVERVRRDRLMLTGRADLEPTPLSVLYGRGKIDILQFNTGRSLGLLLAVVRGHARSGVSGNWLAILAGGGHYGSAGSDTLSANDIAAIEAEKARRVLERVRHRLIDGVVGGNSGESLDDPVELTLAVCSGNWTPIIGGKIHWFIHRLATGVQWSVADSASCERLRGVLGLCARTWSG